VSEKTPIIPAKKRVNGESPNCGSRPFRRPARAAASTSGESPLGKVRESDFNRKGNDPKKKTDASRGKELTKKKREQNPEGGTRVN